MSEDDRGGESEGGHDILTMSYVAVICCGLAGAIVLFLVFAAALQSGGETNNRPAAVASISPNMPNVGMTIPDLPHTGVQDIVSATLTLEDVTNPTEFDVEWDPVPDEPLAKAQAITLHGDRALTVFCSPVWIEGPSSDADMTVSVVATNSEPTPHKLMGWVVVAAGGVRAPAKEIQFVLAPGKIPVQVGTINLCADGPSNWFEPTSEPTPPAKGNQ